MEKIIHILPMNKLGGAEKITSLICKNIKSFDPIIICGGENLEKFLKKENLKSEIIDFNNKNKLSIIIELKKIIITNNVKIIHAHDNIASIYSYLTKKIFNLDIKVISHIHSCYPWLKNESVNKKIDSFFRGKYDKNIACGKFVYDFYTENANYVDEKKFKIISNSIDTKIVNNENNSYKIKQELKIHDDKKVIGFIGRLEEAKGLIPFIKEVSKHKDKFKNCIFLLVGSGSQENIINDIIMENNMKDMFIMTGFKDNVEDYYRVMDIFFMPSIYEGLPMVILEAMLFSKCVVAMNVGSIFEVVKNNNTGILIDKDINKFVENIEELKENQEKIKQLGLKAKELIEEKYSIESYVDKLEDIYLNI